MEELDNYLSNLKEIDGIWYSPKKVYISYPSDGNQKCYQIEEQSFWFQHRNKCILEVFKKYSTDPILFDVGGGNGFVSLAFKNNGFEPVLIEPGLNGCVNAKKRGIKYVVNATLEECGFPNNSISNIGIFDVLEHIEDDRKFLKIIYKHLAEHGKLFLTVPAYNKLWSADDQNAGHFRRYTLKRLHQILLAEGFKIIYNSYIFSLLPVPILLKRTIPSLLGKGNRDNKVEVHKSQHQKKTGFTKLILNSVLKKEREFIKKGLKVPFGSSCLVAAQKL